MKKYIKYKGVSGIYVIKSTINDKIYIGSSINIYNRIRDHYKVLKSNTHKNELLQNHYNKYGRVFYFELLLECNNESLIINEQIYLDKFKSYNRESGFNINSIANSMLGFKFSEESKAKMSNTRKGRKNKKEHNINIGISKQGSKHPRSKLTENDIINIRKEYKFRKNTYEMLAKKYNTGKRNIMLIVNKRAWKHI